MKCKMSKRSLSLFLDGQLSEKQTLKIKTHLDECLACNRELNLLKESWSILDEWRPIAPSPNFKTRFWQRAAEEVSRERHPIFVFPRLLLSPRLVPAFAALGIILIIGMYLIDLFASANVHRLVKLTSNQDIQMLKDLELTQDFEAIQDINTLEDFEIIISLEL